MKAGILFLLLLTSTAFAQWPQQASTERLIPQFYAKLKALTALQLQRHKLDFHSAANTTEQIQVHASALVAAMRLFKLVHDRQDAFAQLDPTRSFYEEASNEFRRELAFAKAWITVRQDYEKFAANPKNELVFSDNLDLFRFNQRLKNFALVFSALSTGTAAHLFFLSNSPNHSALGGLVAGFSGALGCVSILFGKNENRIVARDSTQVLKLKQTTDFILHGAKEEIATWNSPEAVPTNFSELYAWVEDAEQALGVSKGPALTLGKSGPGRLRF